MTDEAVFARAHPTFTGEELGVRDPGDDDDFDENQAELVPISHALAEIQTKPFPGVRFLSTAKLEIIRWLWRNWLARGAVAFVEGDPGLGKSTLVIDIAARITNGAPMPDGSPGLGRATPGHVLFVLAEDTASTARARLEAAGANPERALIMDFVIGDDGEPRPIALPFDIPRIEQVIRHFKVDLLVLDPWFAFINATVDTHNDQSSRQVLTPMTKMAEATGVAIIGLRHWNKGKGSAMQRGSGSVAFTAAARTVLTVGVDPADEQKCVLAVVKTNLGPKPKSLGFSIEGTSETPDHKPILDDDKCAVETNRVHWHGENVASAHDLALGDDTIEGASAIDEACRFLRDELSTGAKTVKSIQAGARNAGVALKTLQRAKKKLHIESQKQDFSGKWVWVLPADEGPVRAPEHGQGGQQDPLPPFLGHVDHLRQNEGGQPHPELPLTTLVGHLRNPPREMMKERDEGGHANEARARARARDDHRSPYDHMDHGDVDMAETDEQ